jgi:hypothetical protein
MKEQQRIEKEQERIAAAGNMITPSKVNKNVNLPTTMEVSNEPGSNVPIFVEDNIQKAQVMMIPSSETKINDKKSCEKASDIVPKK